MHVFSISRVGRNIRWPRRALRNTIIYYLNTFLAHETYMETEFFSRDCASCPRSRFSPHDKASHAGVQTVPRKAEHATREQMPGPCSNCDLREVVRINNSLPKVENRITHSQKSRYLPSKSKNGDHLVIRQHESPCRVSRRRHGGQLHMKLRQHWSMKLSIIHRRHRGFRLFKKYAGIRQASRRGKLRGS